MIRFDNFELDAGRRELLKAGARVEIRDRALDVLLVLTGKAGQVVGKRELCRAVWPDREVDENNLQVEIARLRGLLGKHAIVTASGRGYQFARPVKSDPVPPERAARPRLIGRDVDIAALDAMLAPGAIVTLTGVGGIGKTALARALVARRDARSPGSALFVSLDDESVSEARQAADGAAARLLGSAVEAQDAGPLLIVLDGCDSMLRDAATVAVERAGASSTSGNAAVLVTSREVMRVPEERVYRLGALSDAAGSQLFNDTFVVAGGDPGSVEGQRASIKAQMTRLCRELDGNPLAILITARWSGKKGEIESAGLAAESIGEPDTTSSGLPLRHHSMRASLDWSYAPLGEPDRRVYRELSALPQPFLLEQLFAAPVFARTDLWELAEALTRLVEKSMVAADRSDPPRYRMARSAIIHATQLRNESHTP